MQMDDGPKKIPILNSRNYPFYHQIKRDMHIMEKLLNDENNQSRFEQEALAISLRQMNPRSKSTN